MPDPELDPAGFPVMVGLVPLFCVTSFSLQEGYGSVKVGGTSSSLVQFVRPTTKKIVIKALLPGKWRLLRPAAARLVIAALIAALLVFRAVDAHRQVDHVASELLNQEPCLSSWRAHHFGEAFVPVVKGRYGMDNPRCEDE